jgi:hypothetical protein
MTLPQRLSPILKTAFEPLTVVQFTKPAASEIVALCLSFAAFDLTLFLVWTAVN